MRRGALGSDPGGRGWAAPGHADIPLSLTRAPVLPWGLRLFLRSASSSGHRRPLLRKHGPVTSPAGHSTTGSPGLPATSGDCVIVTYGI